MGLFSFLKKPVTGGAPALMLPDNPYTEPATNVIYNLLFCDSLELYKAKTPPPYSYPFDTLFASDSQVTDLEKIINDRTADPRTKILACNKLLSQGQRASKKELLAVIVEVGLDGGLDVLASFPNGTARYLNQTGKTLIWENTNDAKANQLTHELFVCAWDIVNQIGPWDKPRKAHPAKGYSRITFLVSDGFYFGEALTDTLFADPIAKPTLMVATSLMQYLTAKATREGEK